MNRQQDIYTLWMLSGLASRIAQRLGLHREAHNEGLLPCAIEMRRRIWWFIVVLDSRMSQLSGSGSSIHSLSFDTLMPTNLDDDTFFSLELPPKISSAVFCLVRYEVYSYMQVVKDVSAFDGNWHPMSTSLMTSSAKLSTINTLEKILDEKYIQYCDLSIPLHLAAKLTACSIIAKLRIVALHPIQHKNGILGMTNEECDIVFTDCLTIMEWDHAAHTNPMLTKFLWHIETHFQIDAFILMVSEMRRRLQCPLTDHAWTLVKSVYDHHTRLFNNQNALYCEIGNLVVKAWEEKTRSEADAKTFGERSSPKYPLIPNYIVKLASQRVPEDFRQRKAAHSGLFKQLPNQQPSANTDNDESMGDDPLGYNPMQMFATMPEMTMDWSFWREMLQAAERQ